jgi:hypothetical protein
VQNFPGVISLLFKGSHECSRAADLIQSTSLVRGSRSRLPPITNEPRSPAAHKVALAERGIPNWVGAGVGCSGSVV